MKFFEIITILLVSKAVVMADKNRGYFSLNDIKGTRFNENALSYQDFNRSFLANGFYKFGNFTLIQDYDDHPVLLVYQPDENKNELHGYFFLNGIYSLFYNSYSDHPTYKRIRNFFDVTTEAVTPYAAKFAYPYFYEYPLVHIDNSERVSSDFAVVFAAPKYLRIKGSDEKFLEIIRDKFVKTPFENYDVSYLQYGKDFVPYTDKSTK